MNNVNIFGGSGFIGSRFCEIYKQDVIVQDRDDYKPKTNQILYFISTVDNYNIHKNLHLDINTNLNVLMSVLENIDKNDKDLVFNFVSSWFVYGKNEVLPFNEKYSVCNPTGFYSITKRAAEQMLISFCETFGIKYRIFRLANVLGEGDGKISRKKNALQHMIKCLCEDEEIFLYDGGNAVRDYVYVDDVCDAVMHCMNNAPVNEIINIGSGKRTLLRDLIYLAQDLSNSSSKINIIQPPHFHDVVQVKDSYLDVTKLKSYGFESKHKIEDVVVKLVNYYKNIK
jgi:nucleoside-diphosphate-sugar epimerase